MATDAAIDQVRRELDRAFDRTRADLDRIEILAAGLAAFSAPIPGLRATVPALAARDRQGAGVDLRWIRAGLNTQAVTKT